MREVKRGYGKTAITAPATTSTPSATSSKANLNKIPALLVVTQRPRELNPESASSLLAHIRTERRQKWETSELRQTRGQRQVFLE